MRGIQFLVNEDGEKTAVLLDLQEWGDLWEDFYDILGIAYRGTSNNSSYGNF